MLYLEEKNSKVSSDLQKKERPSKPKMAMYFLYLDRKIVATSMATMWRSHQLENEMMENFQKLGSIDSYGEVLSQY